MIIGLDLDGIITVIRFGFYSPILKLPRWLFIFLFPLTLLIPPDKNAVNKLKEAKAKGDSIIIVSARPAWAENLTRVWLGFYKVPFDKIYCLGFEEGTRERKLIVIREERIERFFDDDERLVELLKKNSIEAFTHFCEG